MKRQLILSFILLLVMALLAACSTPSTTSSDKPSDLNATANNPQKSSTTNTISSITQLDKKSQLNDLSGNAPAGHKQQTGAGKGNDSAIAMKPEIKSVISERRQDAMRKLKNEKSNVAPAESEVVADAAASQPATPLSLSRSEPARLMQMTAPTGVAPGVPPVVRLPSEALDRENYAEFQENPIMLVSEHPVSTFSIDVDTGSYTNTRRILREGRLPAKNVVRVEEFINYFNYDYPVPESSSTPFNVITEVGPTPWNAKTHLLHIGLKGFEIPETSLPPANLVFLVDVSGSMQSPDKLPLLKKSLQLLTHKLRAQDRISLVVYAGASGVVLEPTSGDQKGTILQALESLSAGGSTNGAAGIRLAYLKAQQAFIPEGINRVILATDGDFNVGTTSFDALKSLVEQKRKTGVFLTTLGFGTGNYNDKLMEQLADVGNGNYAYVDSLMEAQKVLVNEAGSTLKTIAKDVKIQIEFNPAVVSEYRLIGYENRSLRREDFNNDKIDAGEIGAGHTVTAIYEVALVEKGGNLIDPLRYQTPAKSKKSPDSSSQEIAFLRLRYKQPNSEKSVLMETPVNKQQIVTDMGKMTKRYKFSASVAGFAQLLRGGQFTQQYSYADVVSMAIDSKGNDPYGYRGEFIQLVELAKTLSGTAQVPMPDMALK